MENIKEILKKDWEPFVKRKSNILERSLRIKSYKEMGCSMVLASYKDGMCQVFLLKDDLKKLADKAFSFLIGKNSADNIERYEKLSIRMENRLKKFSGKELNYNYLRAIVDLIVHCTIMPVYVEACTEKDDLYSEKKEAVKKLSELRYKYRTLVGQFEDILKEKINFPSDFYTIEELEKFFKTGKKLPNRELIKRRRGCLIYYDSERFYIFYEKKEIFKERSIKLFKGKSAYPGKLKGRVSVVLKSSDLARIRKGDILVIHMTEYNMAPLLKGIKALITDEGGVTTHAAIFSREFRIPCIMGTKIATKVLKDGDLVEVDADKGVVKIIK